MWGRAVAHGFLGVCVSEDRDPLAGLGHMKLRNAIKAVVSNRYLFSWAVLPLRIYSSPTPDALSTDEKMRVSRSIFDRGNVSCGFA
jgi:hypothetical protein